MKRRRAGERQHAPDFGKPWEEEEPFKKGFLPHQTHQRGSRPPSTSRDFHKMGRRRERSPFRRELEKSATDGGFPSLFIAPPNAACRHSL